MTGGVPADIAVHGAPGASDGDGAGDERWWEPCAARLADRMRAAGVVTDRGLLDAVAGTPRHRFARWPLLCFGPDTTVYDDELLGAGLPAGAWPDITRARRGDVPPSVLVRLLGLLDLPSPQDGGGAARVLLADLDDGYAAALLCRLLGHGAGAPAGRRGELVCAAGAGRAGRIAADRVTRELGALGLRPRIVPDLDTALGAATYTAIVGGAVSEVPPAWIAALRPGGQLVAWWTTPLATLPISLRHTGHGEVRGTVCPDPQSTAWARSPAPADSPSSPLPPEPGLGPGLSRRYPEVDPEWFGDPDLRRLLAVRDPSLLAPSWYPGASPTRPGTAGPTGTTGTTGTAAAWSGPSLVFGDGAGSWARLAPAAGPAATRCVAIDGGPRGLWSLIEQTAYAWRFRGRPGASRFGITADADGHRVWIDGPDCPIPDPPGEVRDRDVQAASVAAGGGIRAPGPY